MENDIDISNTYNDHTINKNKNNNSVKKMFGS